METVSFERATLEDAPALMEVQIRAFHDDARLYPGVELGGPPGYDQLDVVQRAIQNDLYYKIVHNGKIIGGIVAFQSGEGHYNLDILFVDPAYHNRGIGRQAMHYFETTCPAHLWTLDTPAYATRNQHFYESLGYVKVSEFTADDLLLFHYEKRSDGA